MTRRSDQQIHGVTMDDYKTAHESFVSGHAGTTALEIMLLSLVVPVSILLLALVRKVR